jgi:Tfp pilus assembly protein FimT
MSKVTNESGFSITELAVSMAIMVTLAMISMPYYIEFHENLNSKIQTINEANEAQSNAIKQLFEEVN